MYINPHALLSLVAGILILIRPALLNYIIAIYLILIGVPGMAYGKADQKSWDSLPGLIRRSNYPDLVDTDVVGRTLSQRIRRNRRAATDHLGPRSPFWFMRIQGSIESPRVPKRVN